MVSRALTFEHKKFVPKERMRYHNRKCNDGENGNLNASRDAGNPYEEIEDAKTQDRVQYAYEPVAHELPAENSPQRGEHS